ncbi:hypothetical protein KIW84_062815 [Lathyrus oleraceus]|uniref:BED-type domain-containing protein n=1 Tax=Pisum sativum TaxID=3888 RepID=A0A9D5A6U9_PEA|nr:hypothetical protein KIW84_062815 [Pisum sativum]
MEGAVEMQGAGEIQGAGNLYNNIMENVAQNEPSSLTSGVAATDVVANEIHVVGLPPLGKKRKQNANGPRKSSPAWDYFIKLPNEIEPVAACKHCHMEYLYDPKTHGTSNMLAHTKVCTKMPQNDPTQTALSFAGGEGGGLVAASQRFNLVACRKAISLFVILDEHAFRVVKGEDFKLLCKQLQPQLTIPSRRIVARDCFQLFVDEKARLKGHHPQRSAKFKECIEFARINCKKLLCLDVPTRWDSCYLMLDAAEKYQAAFEKMEGEDFSYLEFFGLVGPPTLNDWENVRCLVSFFKIFYDATMKFSPSKQVSLHKSFHQLASVHCELKRSSMNLNIILASIGYEMKKKYDKYWGEIENINKFIYFGVILDPIYKLGYVKWCFNDMYNGESVPFTNLINVIKKELFKLFNWYKGIHEKQHGPSTSPNEGGSFGDGVPNVEVPSHFARVEAFKEHLKQKDPIDKKMILREFGGPSTSGSTSGDGSDNVGNGNEPVVGSSQSHT